MNNQYDIVIVGGGFGGLHCARKLKKYDGRILLVDKNNYHTFRPLLYQLASGVLDSSRIAIPLREILRDQKNTTVVMGKVTAVNEKNNTIILDKRIIKFKKLVLAIGDRQSYFGHDEWRKYTTGLKNLDDAFKIRNQILGAYERAEKNGNNNAEVQRMLRFVIVGGGPTGVELAGAIAEIANETLVKDFRKIRPPQTEIYLLQAGEHLLEAYDESLSKYAEDQLKKLGVKVLLNSPVKRIARDRVEYEFGEIEAKNIFWAAGNEGHPLIRSLSVELTSDFKVPVKEDLTLPGKKNIYVIGDCAKFKQKGKALPHLAPVAIQQGKYVAKHILREGKIKGFNYFDKGSIATIGKSKAVGRLFGIKIKGTFAWFVWSSVHLYYLILARNRFFLFINWAYRYMTSQRSARIIH